MQAMVCPSKVGSIVIAYAFGLLIAARNFTPGKPGYKLALQGKGPSPEQRLNHSSVREKQTDSTYCNIR